MRSRLVIAAVLFAMCVSPTLAQEAEVNTLVFNDFGFRFDSTLATNVNITQYPGDPIEWEAPGGPEVGHTQFSLYHESAAPYGFDADLSIRIYQTADFAGHTYSEAQLEQLWELLAERPDLAPYMVVEENLSANTLPFMPVLPAAQVIRARARYHETEAVTGISYVTVYRQDASPFTGDEFIYTFQGISADGAYYVSAIFRPTTDIFPLEVAADFDWEAFYDNVAVYFTESIAALNEAEPDDFAPSLTTLDALVETFTFDSASAKP